MSTLMLGLDLGSSYTKGVVVDEECRIIDRYAVKTGFDFKRASRDILNRFSIKYAIELPVFTCGYGRDQVEFDHVTHSEIMALAQAVFFMERKACTIIDIGGQDTKWIRIDENGKVEKFKMNRKCAAGTGSFLEEIAFRLDIPPSQFNGLAAQSEKDIKINSFCTVFAISEIIGLIKNGVLLPDIVVGIYNSVVERCLEMAGPAEKIILTGGVPVNHPAIIDLFRKKFKDVSSPEQAQFLAAWGTVLMNSKCKVYE